MDIEITRKKFISKTDINFLDAKLRVDSWVKVIPEEFSSLVRLSLDRSLEKAYSQVVMNRFSNVNLSFQGIKIVVSGNETTVLTTWPKIVTKKTLEDIIINGAFVSFTIQYLE